MTRKIKVKRSLGRVSKLTKIERNVNLATQLPLHAELTDPPYSKQEILLVTTEMSEKYSLHLTGNHAATIAMLAAEKLLDTYYWDTAEYVEKVANTLNNAALPEAVGLALYAKKKTRKKKGIHVLETATPGEFIVKCSRIKGAGAYMAEVALMTDGKHGPFSFGGACTITAIRIKKLLLDTKYKVIVKGIFNKGEGPVNESTEFRT